MLIYLCICVSLDVFVSGSDCIKGIFILICEEKSIIKLILCLKGLYFFFIN